MGEQLNLLEAGDLRGDLHLAVRFCAAVHPRLCSLLHQLNRDFLLGLGIVVDAHAMNLGQLAGRNASLG